MLGRKLAGRYAVVKPLAEGGFGETFLAEDTHLPNSPQCVVKKLKTGSQEPALLQTVRRLFDSEAKVLHQLGDHPQIPRLLAHFEEGEEFYLAEEYIEGESLADELLAGKQLEEGTVIQLLHDILEVLSFVHEQQVIHRDIKPSNLIRRKRDRKLVLIDFGAVKQVTTQLPDSDTQMPRTVLIGTSGYMPSEQFRGHPRLCSDVYAVGIIAIQALTGLRPSLGELPEDEETGEIAWHDRTSISPAAATLLEKMVLYDYRQRYRSANEALLAVQDLMAARAAGTSPLPPLATPPKTVANVQGAEDMSPQPSLPLERDTAPQLGTMAQTEKTLQQPEKTLQQSETTAQRTPNVIPTNGFLQPETTAQQAELTSSTPQVSSLASDPVEAKLDETLAVSPKPTPRKTPFNRTNALLGGLITVLMGGTVLAFSSPHIQSLCPLLNNCSQDIQFQAAYDQAVEEAKAAQTRFKQAKTVADIQAAQTQLDEAIAEINQIPKNVSIYSQVQKIRATYQAQSKSIGTQLQQEKKAEETFKQANTIAQAVQKQTKGNDSIDILNKHKTEWEKAIKLLKGIPEDALNAAQVKSKQKDFDKQLKALNEQRQQKIDAAAEEQRYWDAVEADRASRAAARSAPAPEPSPSPPRAPRSTYVPPAPAPTRSAPAPAPAPTPAPTPPSTPAPREQEPLWEPEPERTTEDDPLW